MRDIQRARRTLPQPHHGRARRGGVAAAVLLALLATSACSPEAAPTPAVTVTPQPAASKATPPKPEVPKEKPKPKPKPVVWPLTGERTGTKKVPKRASIAVKIENSVESRPHTGLQPADIVWEQVVEGGISRFVAVYHSELPTSVGPVRSVRPMDPAIVAPMHGVLAYTGGQKPFVDDVWDAGVQSLYMDRGDPGFRRSSDRYAPHNVYGNTRTFAGQARSSRAKPPKAQFSYAEKVGGSTATKVGRPARVADVQLSPAQRTVWRWKGKYKAYARSDGSSPSISSGSQLRARNVLLMSVAVHDTKYKDPAGAPVPETRMVGKGDGVLLAGGHAVRVKWSKAGERKPVKLTTRKGDPVLLNPGSLWVELVPRNGGSWRLP